MSALGVQGDPEGWTNAGYTIRAAASQLAEELDSADARGGSGLRKSWHGPMSDAYQDLWNRRYGRYGDLMYQTGRAATALINFGEALSGLQLRAADLERQWLGLGLHLSADGVSFVLPFGHESLAQEVQATLHAFLGESERDVAAMWTDIRSAVGDLVTVLASVVDAIADFEVLAVSVAGSAVGWAVAGEVDGYIRDPMSLGHDILTTEADIFKRQAEHNLKVAQALDKEWSEDGAEDVRTAGRSLVRDATTDDKVAGDFEGFAKIGGGTLMVGSVVLTAAETYSTARKRGWVDGIEEHAGDWTAMGAGAVIGTVVGGAAVGALVVAGAPVAVAAIGVAVGIGVVSSGVGDVTQWYVDNHRQQVGHALTDIGQGVEDAAGWEAQRLVNLL